MTFAVVDSDGNILPAGSSDGTGFVLERRDLVLPYKAEMSFVINERCAGVPTDQAALIDLGADFVRVIPRDGKKYFLKGSLEIPQTKQQPPWSGWYGKLEIPEVEIPTTAPPVTVSATELTQAKGWSEPVNGVRARITMARSEIINGTTRISVRLWLRNEATVLNSLEFQWARASMKLEVVDLDGNVLPAGGYGGSGPGLIRDDLMLPYNGELSFEISTRGAGVHADQAAMIDMGPDFVRFVPRDGKKYFLKGSLEIPNINKAGWHGRMEIPQVEIPTEAAPIDPIEAGKAIETLGAKMLRNDGLSSEAAMSQLSLIADKRVIPWYVKAMQLRNCDTKMAALDRLCRLEGDEALSGINIGMKTRGADIENCANETLAVQSAASVRLMAARALERSPHPDAKGLLLTMADDPYEEVRIEVVRTARKMESKESLSVLERLTKDNAERVRSESVEALKMRQERKTTVEGQ